MSTGKALIFICSRSPCVNEKRLSHRIARYLELMDVGEIAPVQAIGEQLSMTVGHRRKMIFINDCNSNCVKILTNGFIPSEYVYVDVDIDDRTLTEIADMTGGKYFRATDNNKLKEVYKEIDRMEKTIFEEKNFTNKAEHFLPFAVAAAVLLLLEFVLKNNVFRSIP